ncbi:MAG: amidohydrolase family protein [Acidimicrobiales bacterium]
MPDSMANGAVDTLCNAFWPERRTAWDAATDGQNIPLKLRTDPNDSYAAPDAMVARMDDLGIDTVVLVTSDVHRHGTDFDVSSVTARWEETEALVERFPGRFVALWGTEPQLGMAGVERAEEALRQPWVVGAYLHTHSFDRPFDHQDHYPYYALCHRYAVPMVMQAGTSGGRLPSQCGQPIGIDRPALYFPDVSFVLSHTGWPWVDEAIAMALKFSNVYLGTGSYPPRHWPALLVDFLRRPGRHKVLFGTNFPTVGHRQALGQLAELDLKPDVRQGLMAHNARTVFARIP